MKTMEDMILEKIETAEKLIEEARQVQAISFRALAENGQIDADTASAHKDMFKEWFPTVSYKVGEIVNYNDVLYKVVQEHTSQEDWLPLATASLYEPIILTEEGYPVWSKPSGAHDAYNIGDVVDYNGTLYKSLIDGNVYSPEEYPNGWEMYKEIVRGETE
jgi:hypothetical protein